MSNRRVVVTGVGAISPLGLDVEQTWKALVAGRSGISKITSFDATTSSVRIAGQIPGFDAAGAEPGT
jgi:3-oxoacyl-[acyl-carrier-protein] synthase II